MGGEERRFDQTECAFFLHDTETVHDEDRCFPLTPDDFARVNPNTGTAPIFRSRRDAEITRRIYEQHPVLVDHSQGKEKRVWPVKYTTCFTWLMTRIFLGRLNNSMRKVSIRSRATVGRRARNFICRCIRAG